jgi:hypothetical protein
LEIKGRRKNEKDDMEDKERRKRIRKRAKIQGELEELKRRISGRK